MRVADRQGYQSVDRSLSQAKAATSGALENMTTQRKIHKPSDNPFGVTRLIRNQGKLKGIEQFKRNIDYARSYFVKTEETIGSIADSLIRAKELAIDAANGSHNENTRGILSKEVQQLTGHLISLGNSKYADKYIFGGFKTKTPVIDSAGSFMGDDGALFLPIAEESFMQINLNGRQLFQGGGEDIGSGLVGTLKSFNEHLNNNDVVALRKDMVQMDQHIESVVGLRATLGAKNNTLDNVYERHLRIEESLLSDNEGIEGVDFFQSTSDFKQAETVLQSTLLASNKLLQPSLLNFMQ